MSNGLARRTLLLAGTVAAIAPRVAAEEPAQAKQIGILTTAPAPPIDSFRQRLSELGWSEGQNVAFVYRWAEGENSRYPALAADLVARKVDVIVTWSTPAALAAKEATAAIPIVMASIGSVLGNSPVSSLAHPGGNLTGFSSQNLEIAGKHVGLLKDLIPGLRRIAVLSNAANPGDAVGFEHAEKAAKTAGLTLDHIQIGNVGDLDSALPELGRTHPDAAMLIADTLLLAERQRIVDFINESRLPAIYPFSEFAVAGGLISYSPDFDELFRQAAAYVDKILRGTKPGDLPVQQASKFKLVVNLKTAEALGLSVPPLILAQADEVIE
jgi:putative ABC transport system substrate-binding protein